MYWSHSEPDLIFSKKSDIYVKFRSNVNKQKLEKFYCKFQTVFSRDVDYFLLLVFCYEKGCSDCQRE